MAVAPVADLASVQVHGWFDPHQTGQKIPMKLIACNSNLPLSETIADELGVSLSSVTVRRFADMEISIEVHENMRGEDVFVIQSTSSPTNDHLMELLVMIDTLRRGSARRITAVMPYFGYARQDRKSGPRTPITAKLVANLLTEAGAHRVLTLDLHAMQIQGFFDIPVDNLYAAPLFVRDIRGRYEGRDVLVVSPDVGGVVRAREIAQRLNTTLAIVDKRRERPGLSEVMNVIGDVEGRDCVLVDDIIDSGGSLCNAAEALVKRGARSVEAYVTHGVLSGEAVKRIERSPLKMLTVTNTIYKNSQSESSFRVRQICTANLLSQAIIAIANERSVSSLFH